MESGEQKALEEIKERLVKNVKIEIEKNGNPYDFEERIMEVICDSRNIRKNNRNKR